MLLMGDHPTLITLREQVERAKLVQREYSGVGFFCTFEVSSDAPIVIGKGDFEIGDVFANMDGLAHGAGFLLFIRDGYLDFLEGFSYDEPWPSEDGNFTLSYRIEPRDIHLPDASPGKEQGGLTSESPPNS